MTNVSIEDYPEFKRQFWKWFDSLPREKKKTFWYFTHDMAETNFYFTQYSKGYNNSIDRILKD